MASMGMITETLMKAHISIEKNHALFLFLSSTLKFFQVQFNSSRNTISKTVRQHMLHGVKMKPCPALSMYQSRPDLNS